MLVWGNSCGNDVVLKLNSINIWHLAHNMSSAGKIAVRNLI